MLAGRKKNNNTIPIIHTCTVCFINPNKRYCWRRHSQWSSMNVCNWASAWIRSTSPHVPLNRLTVEYWILTHCIFLVRFFVSPNNDFIIWASSCLFKRSSVPQSEHKHLKNILVHDCFCWLASLLNDWLSQPSSIEVLNVIMSWSGQKSIHNGLVLRKLSSLSQLELPHGEQSSRLTGLITHAMDDGKKQKKYWNSLLDSFLFLWGSLEGAYTLWFGLV